MVRKGQSIVEYTFVIVFVALIVIVMLVVLGPQIGLAFQSIRNDL